MNLCSQKGAYRYACLMSYLIAEVDFKMSFLCFQNCYTNCVSIPQVYGPYETSLMLQWSKAVSIWICSLVILLTVSHTIPINVSSENLVLERLIIS